MLAAAVQQAQQGDDEAFRVLYRAVQPGLRRYLRVLVGEQDAEDVSSEAWLQIARDLRSFRGDGAGFRGWAATVARHRALDHLRRRGRTPAASEPEEVLAALITTAGGKDRVAAYCAILIKAHPGDTATTRPAGEPSGHATGKPTADQGGKPTANPGGKPGSDQGGKPGGSPRP